MTTFSPLPPAEAAPRRGVRRGVVTLALAGGLAVGGGAIAYAATSAAAPAGPSTSAAPGTTPAHGAKSKTADPGNATAPGAPSPGGAKAPAAGGKHDGKGAGPGGKHGNPAYDSDGRITAVDGGTLTVADLFGRSRTYTLTSATRIHQGPRQQLTASSLTAGEHVHVAGQPTSSATPQAVDVDLHPAHVDGVVTAVDGSSLTVTDRDGFTRDIAINSGTVYTRSGATVSAGVQTGNVISATGRVDADGATLDATTVDLRVPPAAVSGTPAPGRPSRSATAGPQSPAGPASTAPTPSDPGGTTPPADGS